MATVIVSAANTCTVGFNSLGGSAVASQTVAQGGKITQPVDPTRTGYTFAGWYSDHYCINAWDFANDIVTGDMMLYAKWTQKTVTGVVETLRATSLQIYPNPFTDAVRITWTDVGAGLAPAQIAPAQIVPAQPTGRGQAVPLRVTNAAGVTVHTQTLTTSDETINLKHLPAGVYFFILEIDGKTKTEKAVKIQ